MIRNLIIAAFLFCIPQLSWSQDAGKTKHKICRAEFESLVKQYSDTTQTKEIDVETALQLTRIYNTIKFDELSGASYAAFIDNYNKRYSYKVHQLLEFGKWKGESSCFSLNLTLIT